MKKLLLVGAIALCGLSNAQMTKGDWVISGNTGLGFNSASSTVKANGESEDGPKISKFSITPSVGYFVMDGLAVGIDLGLDSETKKYDGDKTTDTRFSVMPTATYYFNTGSKFFPFVGVGVGYATNKTKETLSGISDNYTADGLTWKAKAGVTYMATQSLGVNLGVGFDQFYSKNTYFNTEVKTTRNNFGVNVGFSYFIKSKSQKSDK
ncbi:OmpW family outer membrane protein [Chryseobacterium turcicum]|uniref:Porin family protein n=1 Tax=Chryseobacterium turcicum TaxID=2898076 RepID=A0A9Q3V306_9FLAO|nr:OmpW family outer membrane protein [Chryseobacterium turcicum]MCD1117016.1 porin family protein [Chryseobacterium turcicum]